VLALINARPSSPTAQEIRNVLAPPLQAPVMAYEHTESPAEGRGFYELDVWSVYAHAASAYIPRLKKTRPDLAGAGLWREALALAMEAGLSIDPLD
jgi:hypothetical protein